MSFTVGRASLPEDPSSATWNGDTLTIEGWISPTVANDTNQAYAIRQQLLGLVDNDDETVFPCTFSGDPNWDGFYSVESVRVEGRPGLMETQGRMPYTLVLRRVGGFTAPQFECIATTVVATNAHGLPTFTTEGIVALPYTDLHEASGPRSFSGSSNGSFLNGTTRTTSDGLIRWCEPADSTPFRFVWATSPAYYYEGSARFEQSFGGTYYEMNGQQVRPVSSAWRISNGLVRVSVSSTTISVSHYDGSAWDTAKVWTLSGTTATVTMQGQPLVRVIRNTPEEVIVRCVLRMETSVSSTTLDISLRRGCRWAAFALSSNYTSSWQVETTPAEAGTALTGGFRATATDASGNRYVVGGLAAQTNSLANGRLKLTTAAQEFQFVIGSEVGADGTGQEVIDQYATAIVENHRVVVR